VASAETQYSPWSPAAVLMGKMSLMPFSCCLAKPDPLNIHRGRLPKIAYCRLSSKMYEVVKNLR
jgi:hypothetical protein